MYFRCSNCHASVWSGSFDAGPLVARCKGCRQEYTVKFEGTDDELHRRALALAARHHIDLPGAYSVVLQLLTVDRVRDVAGAGSERDDGPDPASGRKRSFDPAFAHAVSKGWLTQRQALERGERDQFAKTVRRRHGLPERLAYAVADNQMSFVAALRSQGPGAPIDVVAGLPASNGRAPAVRVAANGSGRFATWTVCAVLFAAAVAWALAVGKDLGDRRALDREIREQGLLALRELPVVPTMGPEPRDGLEVEERPRQATQIESDENEEPVRIVASSPIAVLQAYCSIELACEVTERVELAQAVPRLQGVRLGLFTHGRERVPSAIWIQKDRVTARWVAGDGKRPIPTVPEIDLKVGDPRVAVVIRR